MSLAAPYYQDDSSIIYLGDCRDILPHLPKVDLVLTDPPYGIANKWKGGKGHGWGMADTKKDTRNAWDERPPSYQTIQTVVELGQAVIIWGGNYFALSPSRGWLVWRKEANPSFTLSDAELAWTNLDIPIRVFDHPRSKLTGDKVPEHPTQKPLPLFKWCIGIANKPHTLLDPFMGSGTTLRAAKDLGCKCIGIEIEEKYCEIAARRLGQTVLDFGG